MLNETQIKNAIGKILGDYAGQYQTEISAELQNSIRWLTLNYAFIWNTYEDTSVAHINGLVTLAANTGKILQVIDSAGFSNYVLAPRQKFQQHQRGDTSEVDIYPSGGRIPFSITENPQTGQLLLTFGDGADTEASLTYNILYTKVYQDIAEIAGLDRLYNYLLGRTVYNMLIQTENPDTALLQMYEKMYMEAVRREMDYSQNRALLTFNTAVVSPNMSYDKKSKGI
jgi:hypothetical protein